MKTPSLFKESTTSQTINPKDMLKKLLSLSSLFLLLERVEGNNSTSGHHHSHDESRHSDFYRFVPVIVVMAIVIIALFAYFHCYKSMQPQDGSELPLVNPTSQP